MVLKREYYPSDTLKLINQSESFLVRGGARTTPAAAGTDEKYGAHTIGRHLLKGAPGALGLGVPMTEFRDRFLNSPDNLSSAWAGKGEMAILLCELLNSDMGQLALEQLDKGVHRVMVHYLNLGKLGALFDGLAGSVKFQESQIKVTPASEIVVLEPIINSKTNQPVLVNGVPKTRPKTIPVPRMAVADVKAKQIASVNAVLDRFGSSLHLQTFFPSSDAAVSYAEWRVGGVGIVAAIDKNGKLLTKMQPVG
jgi:hypothetical protein